MLRKRPKKLSDPYSDFSEEELSEILNKNDADLNADDYMYIFQSYLPAGTYEECVYFVPSLLRFVNNSTLLYIYNNYEEDYLDSIVDVLDNFFWWYNENLVNLCQTPLNDIIKQQFEEILKRILSQFSIYTHKCKMPYLRFSSEIETFISGVFAYSSLDFIKKIIVKNLSNPTNYIQAAWLIQICLYAKNQESKQNTIEISEWCSYKEIKTALEIIFTSTNKMNTDRLFWVNNLSDNIYR